LLNIQVISLYSSFVHSKTLKSLSCSSSFPEVCGPHATCEYEDVFEDSNELSHCECNSYAYGEPPNCKTKCEENCNFDEYCDTVQRVCIKKCNEHEDCGIDEYCRHHIGDCRKGCRTHKSCKDNEFCDPHEKLCKIGCRGDEFCKDDEYCDFFKNICLKGCKDDESCEEDEYCDNFSDKICKKGCRECPGNCKKGEFCNSDNHECEKGCEHDTQCESNEICNLSNKKCYSYCYESICGNNSVCTIVNNNRYCSCQPGYFPVSKVGCEPTVGSDSSSINADNLDCQKYCGHQSLCEIENNQISCYCSEDNGKNPFIDCSILLPIVPTVQLRRSKFNNR